MQEIEAKFKLNDISIIKKANLKKIKEVCVLDIYFDNPNLKLRQQDKVLRLRKENDQAYLAFKGPRESRNNLIIREEIEPKLSSFDNGLKVLKNLSFEEVAKIEKIRNYFSIKKYPSLSITIDDYPFIGKFIEVEGEEAEVHSFLKKFKFHIKDALQKNCTELFLDHCKKNRLKFKHPEKHFTFENEK